jgi:L-ascorbate metabolism protein UlaG (beta-lactamase superfamily)
LLRMTVNIIFRSGTKPVQTCQIPSSKIEYGRYNRRIMRVRKFLHSCLLVEKGDGKILFDPGTFSFVDEDPKPAGLTGITAIIITHSHPDHMDAEAIKTIVDQNAGCVIYGNSGIVKGLGEKGLRVQLFESGTREIGEFKIDAYEARHEKIVSGQIPPNTAYVVDENLLNPGDSYAFSLDALRGKFKVLALPTMAPWTNELETLGFASRMDAKRVIPIHDGYVKDFFLRMRYDNWQNVFGSQSVKFERLERAGDEIDL